MARLTRASEVMVALSSGGGERSAEMETMREVVDWAISYLCAPHDELGRDGPVCPFTRPSLDRDAFWLMTSEATDLADHAIVSDTAAMAESFGMLEPQSLPEARYKTLLIIFPHVSDPTPLDLLQSRLKSSFVERGLMIGQFYPGCGQPALWSSEFRPLRSPIPLLAIRHMVASDFPFLTGERAWLTAYFARYAPDVPGHVRSNIAQLILRGEHAERRVVKA